MLDQQFTRAAQSRHYLEVCISVCNHPPRLTADCCSDMGAEKFCRMIPVRMNCFYRPSPDIRDIASGVAHALRSQVFPSSPLLRRFWVPQTTLNNALTFVFWPSNSMLMASCHAGLYSERSTSATDYGGGSTSPGKPLGIRMHNSYFFATTDPAATT